jgi:hypothetical protein
MQYGRRRECEEFSAAYGAGRVVVQRGSGGGTRVEACMQAIEIGRGEEEGIRDTGKV